MPGFVINGSGIQPAPLNTVETRRKHRWLFTVLGLLTDQEVIMLLQKAQRPNFKLEEAVLHHDQEEAYFGGKSKWEPITLSFYDAQQNPDSSAALYAWVNSVIDIPNVIVADPSVYKAKFASLEMVDGAGVPRETWEMYGVWPRDTNWNDLDYTNSEIALIDVVMRYDRAHRLAA